MEDRGLKPLPVFHFSSDLGPLKELISQYKYFALGGLVPYARQKKKLFSFFDKAFSLIGTKSKIHGFGMTGVELLKNYPFYSVDSTSWLGGSMRGEVYEFTGDSMRSYNTSDKGSSDHQTFSFTDQDDKRWMPRVVQNAIEWQKYETYITKLWKARGIEWKN